MGAPLTLAVTDCNRRVRQFLRRELTAEGYLVEEVASEVGLWRVLSGQRPPALVILDPEISQGRAERLLVRLQTSHPELPMVIHSFASEESASFPLGPWRVFVEKGGNSIDRLKAVVAALLRHYPPPIPSRGGGVDDPVGDRRQEGGEG
ncbi:MAG: hypothetical protein JRC92_02905 [Deltaproteobacteria bacterium]|nr:hypothetical protein [Deltaproteobacteria bacterium]